MSDDRRSDGKDGAIAQVIDEAEEIVSGRLDERLLEPSRKDLDPHATKLAAKWIRSVPDASERDRDYEDQARLIKGYDGREDDVRNYYVAQRYLSFVAGAKLLGPDCPLKHLTVSLAEVLLRLNLEQVRRFIAYLRFLDRRFNPAQESLEPGAGAESDYFRAIRTIGEALPRGCTSDAYPGCLVDMRKLSRAARCEAFRGKSDPQSTTHLVDAKVAEPHGLDPEKTTAFVNEFYRWFDSDQASISDETAYLLLRWFRDEPRTVGVLELTTRCFVCRSLSESERHRANSGKSARGANEDRESSQV